MISPSTLLSSYDLNCLTIGVLGGHSALDVCHGAKQYGFRTACVARKGREQTYAKHYKTRSVSSFGDEVERGCIDECIVVDQFEDILHADIQKRLQEMNTIFVHNRYFWVYFSDFSRIENDFHVPMYGSRTLLKLEERNQPFNQYHLLDKAGIRTPKIFKNASEIDRPVLVKAAEAKRSYERGFFIVPDSGSYESIGAKLEEEGKIAANWREATIEEFVVGAPVNFNFFYSPLTGSLELMGTDTRRQTNLDGFLRMTTKDQRMALEHIPLKMIETGHIACTVKESILEKAFDLGEKFVKATQELPTSLDPLQKGIIGPFALQGAVVAEDGKEDIVIFDVSLRIPGSPGSSATPYSGYLHGSAMSVGERIALDVAEAHHANALDMILT